ncbi:MAG: hypothetical protein NZ874_05195, partial [Fimbriimonadales bacterium]|nr:hypothetical protein [Fimbriimonadales bacterium]
MHTKAEAVPVQTKPTFVGWIACAGGLGLHRNGFVSRLFSQTVPEWGILLAEVLHMQRICGVLGILALVSWVFAHDAATRFQQAIEAHGGDAYRALAQRGVKLEYDITSEYGGKSSTKYTLYLRETKRVIQYKYGDDEIVLGYDGNRGWRKNEYLSSSIAQEEEWSLKDGTYT